MAYIDVVTWEMDLEDVLLLGDVQLHGDDGGGGDRRWFGWTE